MPPGEKDQIGNDMEVLFEERNPKMPPLGSRVKRGRDWRYEYQDNLGRGTVIGHSEMGKYYTFHCFYYTFNHWSSFLIV